jgi:hypothetical protein
MGPIFYGRTRIQYEPIHIVSGQYECNPVGKEWKASSSKRTRHINVKYFYIKEKVDNGEIEIEHYPTDQMWTDINTKPKQGAVYRAFRGHVMGIPVDYVDKDWEGKVRSTPPVSSMLPVPKEPKASQECVGGSLKEGKLPVKLSVGTENLTDD